MALALPKHVKDAEKLDASGASSRHLFLWVDPLTRLDIGRALGRGVPTAEPVVDPRITEIWLAGVTARARTRRPARRWPPRWPEHLFQRTPAGAVLRLGSRELSRTWIVRNWP